MITKLEQEPFGLITNMARPRGTVWTRPLDVRIQHSPVMGVFQRICKKKRCTRFYRYNKGAVQISELREVSEKIRKITDVARITEIRTNYGSCHTLYTYFRNVYVIGSTPMCCRKDRSVERPLVIASATLSVVETFSRLSFPWVTQSRTKWYRTSICLEALWCIVFFAKATTPWLSLSTVRVHFGLERGAGIHQEIRASGLLPKNHPLLTNCTLISM